MKIDLTKEEWEFFLKVCLSKENNGYAAPFLGPTKRAKLLEKLGSEWVDDET